MSSEVPSSVASLRGRIEQPAEAHTAFLRGLVGRRFLLGTGRMPHPVGGAMGVALCIAVKRGHTRFDIILNIHKATSRWHCLAVVL